MLFRNSKIARIVTTNRGRPFALVVLALCLALQITAPAPVATLRNILFDQLQRLFPPDRAAPPVTVVEIDERSLGALGQWPWPRNTTARLLSAVQAADPLVVGLDVLMPEPDRSSPDVVAQTADMPAELREQLLRLPSHDQQLARSIAAGPAPVVMGVAGISPGVPGSGSGPMPPVRLRGESAVTAAARYDGLLRSRPELDRMAAGQGLLSVDRDSDGILRRLPVVAWVNNHPFPSLATEMLRQAQNAPALDVSTGPRGIAAVEIGRLRPPVNEDGTVWMRFSSMRQSRTVSALDVLDGRIDPAILRDHLVLIGATALGLGVQQMTPVATALPAVEIHAQLIEAMINEDLLRRPDWTMRAEALLLLVLGLTLIVILPRIPGHTHWAVLGMGAAALGLSVLAFTEHNVLLDTATPLAAMILVHMAMSTAMAVESERQRQNLQLALEDHRLRMAHMGGELAAERRAAEDRLHFIDMISHEYRTPLSVVRTGLDVLDLRLQDPAHVKSLSRMRRAVVRLTEIVDVGLARARLEVSQIPLERAETDLAQCLADAVSACRAAHPMRTVTLTVPQQAPKADADAPMLKTAFLNLIDNALKYSDEAHPVMVRLAADAEQGACRVVVADQGIGMNSAEMARVFEKFYRAPQALPKQGTGVGLSITRRIIELHGGKIELNSHPGEGTTATITLPTMAYV